MVKLYHYTDRAGKDGIYADKFIRATDAGDELGKVVRFTELDSETDQATLIANNWGPTGAPPRAKDKLRFWFWFELDDLPQGTKEVSACAVGERNIWICPVNVPLASNARDTTTRRSTTRRASRRQPTPPLQSDANRTVLYHYTDLAGKDAIRASGILKAVRPHGGKGLGATMPIAVYFTETIPTAPKEDLLFHMYGTRDVVQHADWLERTRFWFKFDSKDLPGVYKRQTRLNRNEWVCEQDVIIANSTILQRGQRR